MFLIRKSTFFSQNITVNKQKNFLFISHLKKPVCVSKQDRRVSVLHYKVHTSKVCLEQTEHLLGIKECLEKCISDLNLMHHCARTTLKKT